jgi:hypothetical protein
VAKVAPSWAVAGTLGDLVELGHGALGDAGGRLFGHRLHLHAWVVKDDDPLRLQPEGEERAGDRVADDQGEDRVPGEPGRRVGVGGAG